MGENPRVFVSHAGEDQPRFVQDFCTQLMRHGVDAWYSGWEMKPGDSLVEKMFSGIDSSSAFIVVISRHSVRKPWVQEELEAAIARSVAEDRNYRIIPLVIDEEVQVPTSVRARLWITAYLSDEEGRNAAISHAVKEVVRTFSSATSKPPLASFESPLAAQPSAKHDDLDALVLFELAKRFDAANRGEGWLSLDADGFAQELSSKFPELEVDEIMESIYYLLDSREIDGNLWAGGGAWLTDISPRAWRGYAKKVGHNLEEMERRFLAYIVNGTYTHELVAAELPSLMLRRIVFDSLKSRGLINGSMSMSGIFYSQGARPAARRYLRDN